MKHGSDPMAHCRALIVLKAGLSPGQLLPPLLQSMGLEVEQPGRHSLMALERLLPRPPYPRLRQALGGLERGVPEQRTLAGDPQR